MLTIKQLIVGLLLLGMTVVTACSPLSRLEKAVDSTQDGFRANLAQEYLSFAQSEAELGRQTTRDYFAEKGLRAAQGQPIPPEDPTNWMVSDEGLQTELKQARGRRRRVRTECLQRVAGYRIARAQLYYECWVVQAYEGTERDANLPCRQEFISEMEAVEQVTASLGPKPDITLPVRFTVLFPLGEAGLTHDALYGVGQAVGVATLFPNARIVAEGHADRSGGEAHNLALSQARVESVQEALLDAGIEAERIRISAVGESAPATPTLDGIRRDRNRRVEIWVLPPEQEPPTAATDSGEPATDPTQMTE